MPTIYLLYSAKEVVLYNFLTNRRQTYRVPGIRWVALPKIRFRRIVCAAEKTNLGRGDAS